LISQRPFFSSLSEQVLELTALGLVLMETGLDNVVAENSDENSKDMAANSSDAIASKYGVARFRLKQK